MEFQHDGKPIGRNAELRTVRFGYWQTETQPFDGFSQKLEKASHYNLLPLWPTPLDSVCRPPHVLDLAKPLEIMKDINKRTSTSWTNRRKAVVYWLHLILYSAALVSSASSLYISDYYMKRKHIGNTHYQSIQMKANSRQKFRTFHSVAALLTWNGIENCFISQY